MKIGIFYGSTTGKTEDAAKEIAKVLGVADADIHNVANASPDKADAYEALVLGTSTWGDGDTQDDWQGPLEALAKRALAGKKVAVFGYGDSGGYPDTFCNGMRVIYDALANAGVTFVGAYTPKGYEVTTSGPNKDGQFVGLVLDENDDGKTPERIAAWAQQVKAELAA